MTCPDAPTAQESLDKVEGYFWILIHTASEFGALQKMMLMLEKEN